ncbi:MAG: RluA family pseudouridine synthase [Kiritimatiellae bacterium]|nr:RluA family pseudouridine synthase [Kiritimatiellia bacterium]
MVRKAPRHASSLVTLTVGKTDAKFLQDFLAARLALSRRTAKAVIDGRNVWVNRQCVWMARYALETGDKVEIPSFVANAARRQSGEKGGVKPGEKARHIRVLWQDENYLVADKPAGVVSCDDPKSAEAVLREQEKIPTLEAVHRLDRDTTGCLLFAKNHAALAAMIDVFKTHKATKIYHAIAAGEMKWAKTRIDTPLDGDSAVTHVSREAVGDDATFVRVRIETGRTNQIRRHLAGIRHSVVGDRVFGLKSAREPRLMSVARQMLHASTLTLPNPLKAHAEISVHSPLPADFRSALELFGMGKKKKKPAGRK